MVMHGYDNNAALCYTHVLIRVSDNTNERPGLTVVMKYRCVSLPQENSVLLDLSGLSGGRGRVEYLHKV